MSNDLVDSGAEPSGVVAVKGKSQEVSLQVYQDVYNSLTGKSEIVTRMFYDAHQTFMSDLENLHRSLETALEQYDCTSSNCSISVKYCDGKVERFSSLNRFKLDGANRSVPIEDIDLEYDFLIVLPKTQEAKPYKVVIGVRSTIGVVERLRRTNASEIEKNMFFQLERGTARLEIHYIDLAVARSLEAVVEDWYRSLRKEGSDFAQKVISVLSVLSQPLVKVLAVAGSMMLCIWQFEALITDSITLFRFGLISAALLSVSSIIAFPMSVEIRKQIDRARSHSCILVSQVDRDLGVSSKHTVSRTLFGWFWQTSLAVGIGLLTTYLGTSIGM